MNTNAVVSGVNTGMNMIQKRADLEQKLGQQQETHDQNTKLNEQNMTMNDLKIQSLEQSLDETNRANFRRDSDAALDSWAAEGDPTLFKTLKDNPQFKKLFGDVADIKSVDELNTFDGLEDQLLIENGIPEAEIAKLSFEDKKAILHAQGNHLAIITNADGSRTTTSLDELSATTGKLSRASKKTKEQYAKVVAAGGIKRALALATVKDDKPMIESLTETLKLVESQDKSSGGKITKDMQNALFISNGNIKEAREIMKNKLVTSKTRNLNEQAAIMDKVPELAEDVTNGRAEVYSKAVLPAYNIETEMINKNPALKKIVTEFSDTLDALTGFSRVAESIIKTGMTKNVATELRDKVTAMSNKGIDKVSKMWTNTDDATKFVHEAEKFTQSKEVSRKLVNKELQIATLTLIKAMSGLAVSDDERKIYMKLTGADGMASAKEVFLSAMAFIGSKRATLNKQIGRIAGTARIHAAQFTKQVNDSMFKFDPTAPKSEKDKIVAAKNRAIREKESARKASEMYKSFLGAGK